MNGPDPLAQLKDIHLPDPVSWWPPAPGWWLLAIVLVAMVMAAGYFLRRYLRRNRYRREALKELQQLNKNRAAYSQNDLVEQLAILLRRVAIQNWGREAVAPLVGRAWLGFLDSKGANGMFTAGPGQVLGEGLYRQTVDVDLDQLLQLVEQWIRRSRPC